MKKIVHCSFTWGELAGIVRKTPRIDDREASNQIPLLKLVLLTNRYTHTKQLPSFTFRWCTITFPEGSPNSSLFTLQHISWCDSKPGNGTTAAEVFAPTPSNAPPPSRKVSACLIEAGTPARTNEYSSFFIAACLPKCTSVAGYK